MSFAKEHLILSTAQENNILPLTSACNLRCVFCSHRQNPKGVSVYSIGHRSLDEIELTLDFLDGERKIVIGESVTRVIEGEPFLHPEIKSILLKIRDKFPDTPVQITTNGTRLTDDILDLIEELKEIELYISLNAVNKKEREVLMGKTGETVLEAIPQLKGRNISFQGSIVAMPWIVGWDEMEDTIAFLDQNGAETIRIFMPGYTRLAPEELRFDDDLPERLLSWVKGLREKYDTPLIVEPPFLKDLVPKVEGVIKGTPGEEAGFHLDDKILEIGGVEPFSRVDAFHKLARSEGETILVERGEQQLELTLDKSLEERSGLVFAYDLHPEVYNQILKKIISHKAKRPLLMASTLAYPLLSVLIERINESYDAVQARLVEVPNKFFGGSIMAGGLLVLKDFQDRWTNLDNNNYDLILLPGIFLESWGVDLIGDKLVDFEDKINIPIEVIEL